MKKERFKHIFASVLILGFVVIALGSADSPSVYEAVEKAGYATGYLLGSALADSSSSSTSSNVTGRYGIQTTDVEIYINLYSDSTVNLFGGNTSGVFRNLNGTYTVSGNRLTLFWSDGSTDYATINSNSIVFSGVTFNKM